ncbi:hypothetical protein O181_132041, partial [Austropuccinia psidii MF-1]|nr:hypothetical protein [Austropuccinia psidii MF-1]
QTLQASNIDTKQNLGTDSDQKLKPFQDLILDVMISYIIFKSQENIEELSPPNQSEQRKRPKNTKNENLGSDEISSLIINHRPQSSTLLDNQALQLDQAKNKLSEYCSWHNFLPFAYFLILGVKGLFTSHKDHLHFSISNAMIGLCSFNISHQLFKPSPPEEHVWKNLSFHLNSFFSTGMNPIIDVQLVCPPSRHQLAQYITSDFLNQWEAHATVTSLLPPNKKSCLT